MTPELNFDDFLKDAHEKVAATERDELIRAHVETHYEEVMAEFNPFPRFSDPDPDVQKMLKETAIEDIGHQLAENITLPEGMSYVDFEPYVFDEALSYVELATMQEVTRRTMVIAILGLHELAMQQPGSVDADVLASFKKQLIADMMVIEDFEAESSWIGFVNHVIPGEHFDPTKEEDQAYMINALQAHANSVDEHDRIALRQQAMVRIINPGYSDNDDDDLVIEKNIESLRITGTLMIIGSMQRNKVERESEIVAACAEFHLDQSVIAQLLAFLADEYPTN